MVPDFVRAPDPYITLCPSFLISQATWNLARIIRKPVNLHTNNREYTLFAVSFHVKVAPGAWKRNTNNNIWRTVLTDIKSVRLIMVKSPRLIIGGYESRVLINLSNCKENTLGADCALWLFKELFMWVMRVARVVTNVKRHSLGFSWWRETDELNIKCWFYLWHSICNSSDWE
jgi:hypothetical protein